MGHSRVSAGDELMFRGLCRTERGEVKNYRILGMTSKKIKINHVAATVPR